MKTEHRDGAELSIGTKIKLDRFKPRWYQAAILDALENKGYSRILAILPRRAWQGYDRVPPSNSSVHT